MLRVMLSPLKQEGRGKRAGGDLGCRVRVGKSRLTKERHPGE